MISNKDKETILDRSRIEDVVGDFIPLERSGSRFRCCCPVHNERTPSFIVDPSRNTYHCFGCGIHGNAISFLMEVQQMTYREACRWLAKKYSIDLDESWTPKTDEERELQDMKESMLAANQEALAFFSSAILADDPRAKGAYAYAAKRWGKNYVAAEDIGWAPGNGSLMRHMTEKGFTLKLLISIGLLGQSNSGRIYDAFWDRIVIPIRDRYRKVIGFTARRIDSETPKYINSPESPVYSKGKSLFGIHNIHRQALKEEVIYLVEGGPDVMRLQSIGINNTVAALGTAWTPDQFELLRRYSARLCFIPDYDPVDGEKAFGAGIQAVIKNGIGAIKAGFNVTVKELPVEDPKKKADPDSFISSKAVLSAIPEVDFIPWYAAKLSNGEETSTQKAETVKKIAAVLALVDDRLRLKMYVSQIAKQIGIPVSIVQNYVNELTKGSAEQKKKKSGEKIIDQDLYKKYGFFERDNRYLSIGKDGEDNEWSNFIMIPLIHVKDPISSKRLYKLKNNCGQEAVVEMKQEDLVSLQRFKVRTENEGNFRWRAKEDQLNMLKGLLYEAVEPAKEITQLGWQREEFFAFGNGVFDRGRWIDADQYGIIRLDGKGCFYLPSSSILYAGEKGLFQFERRFVHTDTSEITFREYADLLSRVFGDNAKVGICFYLATLFKDVVVGVTEKFPFLNLFGEKGSGKSSFGEFMMSFFVPRNKATNLTQATIAGLAAVIAQVSNALVHIDEYKNDIDKDRREILKSLYDGVGRSRMNMDRDKKKEVTAVDCGVMLSGQEMPTVDIAIFARTIFLTFDKTVFTPEEQRGFNQLSELRDSGCTHITLQLLRHRTKFEEEFKGCYASAWSDIQNAISGQQVEDRVARNWTILLAAFRTLEGVIDVGFDYREILALCTRGILRQNSECRSSNEMAGFWNTVDFMHQNGDIFNEADYRIRPEVEFKGKGMKEAIVFKGPRKVLYLCPKRVFMLYKMKGKLIGDSTLPVSSLRHYLEHCREYLGTKSAMRFKNISNNQESYAQVTTASGTTELQKTSRVDWALCFDYDALCNAYGINLEVDSSPSDEPDPLDIDTSDRQTPY